MVTYHSADLVTMLCLPGLIDSTSCSTSATKHACDCDCCHWFSSDVHCNGAFVVGCAILGYARSCALDAVQDVLVHVHVCTFTDGTYGMSAVWRNNTVLSITTVDGAVILRLSDVP